MSAAEVLGLSKAYTSFTLKDVSFTVDAGRITGFIGRNGAGKTTTIKAMLNLIRPDSGCVSYFGRPLAGNEDMIKQDIGYSTGGICWYPRKRIKDIVGVQKRFYSAWDNNAYHKYLRLFYLDENKTPGALSDGMKVKCNLMLALSHRAKILILDEPTSGLDPFSRDELLRVFTVLKDGGVGIFFSTHIISDIEKCADDIIYISSGRIVYAGSKSGFAERFSLEGESLEDTMLRLERGDMNA